MGHGDALQTERFGHGGKKLVAQASRGIFHIPTVKARFAGDIGAAGFKFQMELPCECLYEAFVLIRFRSAQLVVEMQNKNRDPKLSPQLAENPEQRQRIGAARNADADPVARPDHGVPVDGLESSFVKVFFHWKKA